VVLWKCKIVVHDFYLDADFWIIVGMLCLSPKRGKVFRSGMGGFRTSTLTTSLHNP
jgi:hypothetical protein